MKLRDDYKDILIVDEKGRIEYFNMGYPEFFDLKLQELMGKKIPQLYANLDENTSTLSRAANRGEESLGCVQELVTSRGRVVRQESDTLCIRDGNLVVGAIEFDYFDEKEDIIDDTAHLSDEGSGAAPITLDDVVGQCPEMETIKARLKKVIDLDSPVLLAGETGTGKEMIARAIHNESKRSGHEFVYVNCSALPENLLESLLFGIRKGSFTDAKEKDGLFQMANCGTLFLDEVDSMSLAIQGKLLKCIEEKRIRPVGGEDEISVDVRIISSCNTTIPNLMTGSRIRRDLYFRLSVIQFELPPLRLRGEDALHIADYYIRYFNLRYNKDIKGLDGEAEGFFREYCWPGNVRELRNLIEYAFHGTGSKPITCELLRERMDMDRQAARRDAAIAEDFFKSGLSLRDFVERLEHRAVETALSDCGGDLRKAAARLEISQQVLKYKLDKYK